MAFSFSNHTAFSIIVTHLSVCSLDLVIFLYTNRYNWVCLTLIMLSVLCERTSILYFGGECGCYTFVLIKGGGLKG